MAQRDATIRELEEENDHQSFQLIEREALIKQLEQQLLSKQRLLDDSIHEVVRVKAKQRSLESRAEAASEMAEAEIALKSFRDKAGKTSRPELIAAEQLLSIATKEFENENLGGALYLVSQAKSQIKIGTLKLSERAQVEELQGETPFAAPLPLMVDSRSNVREGPGRGFKVLATLDEGTHITAYSTKGEWLRVKSDDGWAGWIHRSLVSAI
ncbi:MAG: SH3 domain-containing protein [Acidobacteria bacterium]|nr:SH3 domain-containing protein [Acidobacteriota bacterium]